VTANAAAVEVVLAAYRRATERQATPPAVFCARMAYYALLTGAVASLSVAHSAHDILATARLLLATLRPCADSCNRCV